PPVLLLHRRNGSEAASINRYATSYPLRSRVRNASYSCVNVSVISLTVLLERINCPNAFSKLYSISRCDRPPAYISTINRFKLSLVFANSSQSWERLGSDRPLIWGTLSRNPPSAVLSVPSSYPFR